MTSFVKLLENLLHSLLVPRLGCANEVVVGATQAGCKSLPLRCQFITIVLRCFSFGKGGLLNFLPVFVKTRQKESLHAHAATRARNHVGDDFFVGVAKVRPAIHVINGGGQVKALAHRRYCGQGGGSWQGEWIRGQGRPGFGLVKQGFVRKIGMWRFSRTQKLWRRFSSISGTIGNARCGFVKS